MGIPWVKGGYSKDGADCWGLVIIALRDVCGIQVEELHGCTETGEGLSNVIAGEIASPRWNTPDIPRAGDVVVMYSKGHKMPGHVGVFIGKGSILHSPESLEGNSYSHIHSVRVLSRVFLRLEYYRYHDNSNI